MCGIVGYVGKRPCRDLIVAGLEKLEYRGYDSAGIALLEDEGLEYDRAVGNLQVLKKQAGSNGSHATTGLGHTRWATHGAVTLQNAHPLTGCDAGKLAIVLNGIVENYRELKGSLEAEWHRFQTETDAEVVVHLIERHYDGDLLESTRAAYPSSRATSHSSSSITTTRRSSWAHGSSARCSSASATARCSWPRWPPPSSARRARSS